MKRRIHIGIPSGQWVRVTRRSPTWTGTGTGCARPEDEYESVLVPTYNPACGTKPGERIAAPPYATVDCRKCARLVRDGNQEAP